MPGVAVENTVKVIVDEPEPGAPMVVALKLKLTPVGWPVRVKEIAELKPPPATVVIVEAPLPPGATVTEAGEAEIAKFSTFNTKVMVCVNPPPLATIVIG